MPGAVRLALVVIARVVKEKGDARLALATTTACALGLAGVVVDDLLLTHLLQPPHVTAYAFVALLIGLSGVGPWLARRHSGSTMNVRCEPGVVRAGRLAIHAADVTALHIATGARGRSVAIARGTKIVFLEVERASDALRIAEALELPRTPFGELRLRPASRALAAAQALLTVLAVAFGPLYFAAAVYGYDPIAGMSGKGIFGVGGVAASWFALALLVVRRFVPAQALAMRSGAWDAHVALHQRHAAEAATDGAEPSRVANLARGDEPIGAWLGRIDAIPSESHAYRGAAMNKEMLWATLGDDGAAVDARMGAARVLRRRHGEHAAALVRVVDDRDVRVRVDAALEEQGEAEERLERLGPLFRAR